MSKPSCRKRGAGRPRVRPAPRLGRFHREEHGGILIFSLFMFIGMLAMSGIAIDFMRFEVARTQLQATLDRAVLAAAGLGNELDARDVVMDYFDKAGLSGHISRDDIDVVESKASGSVSYRRVSATASAQVDTFLLHLVNIDTLSAGAAGAAEEGITDLEISMVLDVSGSMGNNSATGKTKIHELREAAKDFVYFMQCNQTAERSSGAACTTDHGKVAVSLVPYSEQVNVGPALLAEYKATTEHSSSHCVNFEETDFQSLAISTTDQLDRTGHFDPWKGRKNWAGSWTCKREGWREIKPYMDDHNDAIDAIDDLAAGGNTSIDLGVKWGAGLLDPDARSVVTNLTAKSRPGETGPVIDPVFLGRPYDYTQDYNMKVIVLMTDGQNTSQHYLKTAYRSGLSDVWHFTVPDGAGGTEPGGHVYSVYYVNEGKYRYVDDDGDNFDSDWHDAPYAGEKVATSCVWVEDRDFYWQKKKKKLVCNYENIGTPYQLTWPQLWAKFPTDWYDSLSSKPDPVKSHGNTTKNTRLVNICSAAKAKGVLIYSIGFEVPPNSNAETVMKACASNINNYFAASGTDLAEVFASIATSINKLRLIQ